MSDEANKEAAAADPYATCAKPHPTAGLSPPTDPEEQAGTMIGPYKLLQKLGKGGMGVVWMAEQSEPVHRRVAIKIIKADLQGNSVLVRFEAERQALAMMDHPNIARVLDAGSTAAGRPYFVMELVKGIPFTKYCDQEHLTPKERLELFIPVCHAVQHAHQKGIIHRDLKPSNVLVALYDGRPAPKVIDFGLAKATHQKLTEKTMCTEVGQILGTLEYMAPEQAELNNLDIDTRADIYSLGVMLYELLTGTPPFSYKQLRGGALSDMLRVIREVEPSKPSTRISSSHELPRIAARCKLEPKSLARMVRGDLDWVIMKCLEKDRSRRYETANQLGDEIRRYLCHEPVQAGPPSMAYRTRKFLRRNKGAVIAASLIFLALVAGIVGIGIGLVQAESARKLADDKRREAEHAKQQLERERDKTNAVNLELEALREEDLSATMIALLQSIDADRHAGFYHFVRKILLVILLGRIALADSNENQQAALANWQAFELELKRNPWWENFIGEDDRLGDNIRLITSKDASAAEKRRNLLEVSQKTRKVVGKLEEDALNRLRKPCCLPWDSQARKAAEKLLSAAREHKKLTEESLSYNQFWRAYCGRVLFGDQPVWMVQFGKQLEVWEASESGRAPAQAIRAMEGLGEQWRAKGRHQE